MEIYNKYSVYLKNKYGAKVYKLPLNIPVTCPNRDGYISTGGCTFCGLGGAGFECLPGSLSVPSQLEINMRHIKARHKAEKFIAYFQNYSNTYLPVDTFKAYIEDAVQDDIVEIAISTRPDCAGNAYLSFLRDLKADTGINITIELGLQTANYHTLSKVNRGHSLAEYIDAMLRIKEFGLGSCTHVILNLPWDDMTDVIETAKIISALNCDQVKLHALYILKDTPMGKMYLEKQFEMISVSEYMDRVITFLEYLAPSVIVQRLIGRAPAEDSLFVNWGMSWWKIRDAIEAKMIDENHLQGRLFNLGLKYTNL